MSRLNPEDNHKGFSHLALLEILKNAAKRAWDTYSPASALMTEMREKRVDKALEKREQCDIQCSSLGHAAGVDKSTRARLT